MEIVYGFDTYCRRGCFAREFIVGKICSILIMKKGITGCGKMKNQKQYSLVQSWKEHVFFGKFNLTWIYLLFLTRYVSTYYMSKTWKWEKLGIDKRFTQKILPVFGYSLISQWYSGRLWLKSLSFQAPINTTDSANNNILTRTVAGSPPSSILTVYIHTIKML